MMIVVCVVVVVVVAVVVVAVVSVVVVAVVSVVVVAVVVVVVVVVGQLQNEQEGHSYNHSETCFVRGSLEFDEPRTKINEEV